MQIDNQEIMLQNLYEDELSGLCGQLSISSNVLITVKSIFLSVRYTCCHLANIQCWTKQVDLQQQGNDFDTRMKLDVETV